MKTTIDKEFQLKEPIARIWEYLSDPTKVVACVPGASITEKIDDRNYTGQVTFSIGPVKASYSGEINIAELDAMKYRMTLVAKGVDSKGKGSADMTLVGMLNEADGETRTKFSIEISIAGILAQFGARLIKDVSDQLLNQFIDNFKNRLAGQDIDNTMRGTSLLGAVFKGAPGGHKDKG